MPKTYIEELGRCKNCKKLITTKELLAEALRAAWNCPGCGKVVTYESFGYKGENEEHRFKWIGPNGRWTRKRPANDFQLGELSITVNCDSRPPQSNS